MASPTKPNIVSFGAYEFNPGSRELRKEGMRVRLEGQPLAILEVLLERPGEVVTREELQQRLWLDTFVDFEHSLNAAIKRLRAALSDSADQPRYIETLARRGYRFIAPVGGSVAEREIESAASVPTEAQAQVRVATDRRGCGWPWSLQFSSSGLRAGDGGYGGIEPRLLRYRWFVRWPCFRCRT